MNRSQFLGILLSPLITPIISKFTSPVKIVLKDKWDQREWLRRYPYTINESYFSKFPSLYTSLHGYRTWNTTK